MSERDNLLGCSVAVSLLIVIKSFMSSLPVGVTQVPLVRVSHNCFYCCCVTLFRIIAESSRLADSKSNVWSGIGGKV